MNASVQGALAQINKSWKAFTHNGKCMTKKEVKAVLEYADKKGYTGTDQLTNEEIDSILINLP